MATTPAVPVVEDQKPAPAVPEPAQVVTTAPAAVVPAEPSAAERTLKEENERLKNELAVTIAATRPDATQEEKHKAELLARDKRIQELEADRARRDREALVLAAARQQGFVDDHDALRFVDLPDTATPQEVADAVRQVAEKKLHLIKGTIPSGTGSGPSSGFPTTQLKPEDFYGRNSKPGAAEQLNALSRSNPAAYKSLRAAAKSARLI